MGNAEFDRFADQYTEQHRLNIAFSGEIPEYFAEYKIAELKRTADRYGVGVSRILDFGSGVGYSIPHVRKHFPTATLTCADISFRSLEVSQSHFPDVNHLLVDEGRIRVEDDSVDLTFSACVFHHIPHSEHIPWLRELLRVTRRGGLVAIFEHNPLNPLTVHAVNTCPFDVNARLILARHLFQKTKAAGWDRPSIRYHCFFPRKLALLRQFEYYLEWIPFGAQYSIVWKKP
jgi:SAM-dependent methyltransferase